MLVKTLWGWCPGADQSPKQALWGTTALYPILPGYGIAPCPTALSPPHRCSGTVCRGAAQQHREQHSRTPSSSYAPGTNLFRQKAGFVPLCTERNMVSYLSPQLTPAPQLSPPAPAHLVVPSTSISHTSLLFPEELLLPSPPSTGKMLH